MHSERCVQARGSGSSVDGKEGRKQTQLSLKLGHRIWLMLAEDRSQFLQVSTSQNVARDQQWHQHQRVNLSEMPIPRLPSPNEAQQSVCEQVLVQLLQQSAPYCTEVALGLPLRPPRQAKPPGLIAELCLSPQAQRWIDTLGCVTAFNLPGNKAGNKHINKTACFTTNHPL